MRGIKTSGLAAPAAVPGPAPIPLRGLRMLVNQPPTFFAAMRDEYGPVVRLALPGRVIYLVSEPETIQDVLVTSSREFGNDILRGGESDAGRQPPLAALLGRGLLTSDGEFHRQQRRLIQPLFHAQRVAEYATAFAELAEQQAASWQDGMRLDILDEMVGLTLAIVARTVFSVPLGSAEAETIRTAMPRNDGPLRWALMPGGEALARLPLPSNIQFRRGRAALDTVVYRLIAQRRLAGPTGTDLLSLLLQARDADTGEPMNDRQVRDEALTLLMAGHDTTANALAWVFHLLGRDTAVRERLHAEVDEVLGDRLPTAADIPRLSWTQAVFHEALRVYPPVWTVGRRPLRGRVVGGYLLPADAIVMMSPWVVHRDPRWWPEPDRFAPQRWVTSLPAGAGGPPIPGAEDPLTASALQPGRPRFAYFPFGGGARQCIGRGFAHAEAVLALATICRDWRFEPVPGTRVVPQAKVIVRPRPGVPMTAHRRA